MTERKIVMFRLDGDLIEGLKIVRERDGILPSEQARRAVRAWLEAKGVMTPAAGAGKPASKAGKTDRKRASTRKRS